MIRHVLDASALLAMLHDEPGGESVRPLLPQACISSVNWAEVVQKCLARGVETTGLRSDLEALGLQVLPFTPEDAETNGRLWSVTRSLGLSLGDRACLALGLRLSVPVLTTDKAWVGLRLNVPIQLLR